VRQGDEFAIHVCENGGSFAREELCRAVDAVADACGPELEGRGQIGLPDRILRVRPYRLRRSLRRLRIGEAGEKLGYAGAIKAWAGAIKAGSGRCCRLTAGGGAGC
jgi:hypothetical protein